MLYNLFRINLNLFYLIKSIFYYSFVVEILNIEHFYTSRNAYIHICRQTIPYIIQAHVHSHHKAIIIWWKILWLIYEIQFLQSVYVLCSFFLFLWVMHRNLGEIEFQFLLLLNFFNCMLILVNGFQFIFYNKQWVLEL